MQAQYTTPYALNVMLSGIRTALQTGGNLVVHLFQNDIIPGPASVLTDFTEATFDGYTSHAVALTYGPARQLDGSFKVFNEFNWIMTGHTTPNTIFGYYRVDFAGNLVDAGRFDTPIAMADEFSALPVEISVILPPQVIDGGVVPIP